MAKSNYSKSTEDLLANLKRTKKDSGGEEYLKASDFYVEPELTNEDYYPSKDRSILVGQSPMSHLGGTNPIFVGYGNELPQAPIAKRKRAMDEAALNAKLYNASVDAKAEAAVPSWESQKVIPEYNISHNVNAYQGVEDIRQKAYNDPRFKSRAEANRDLASDSGIYGSELTKHILTQKALGENYNALDDIAKSVKTHLAAGDYVPPGLTKAVEDFYSGKMSSNSDEIIKGMTAMSVGNNLLPEINALSSQFKPNKDKGVSEVKAENIEPSARALVVREKQNGQSQNLAITLGLPPTATEDEQTAALVTQIQTRHGIQKEKPKAPKAAGSEKVEAITEEPPKKEYHSVMTVGGETADENSVVTSLGGVSFSVPQTADVTVSEYYDPSTQEMKTDVTGIRKVSFQSIRAYDVFSKDMKTPDGKIVKKGIPIRDNIKDMPGLKGNKAKRFYVPVLKTAVSDGSGGDEGETVYIPLENVESQLKLKPSEKEQLNELKKKILGQTATDATVVVSDGSDVDSWDAKNSYKVGDVTYFYDATDKKWHKK